ncbi:MAG: hypothetical protein ACYCXQ_11965 [Candidatus Humimicrobiaceae bacterium]
MNKKSPFGKYALEYDEWFDENKEVYHSELLALKETVPANKKLIETPQKGYGKGSFVNIKAKKSFGSLIQKSYHKMKLSEILL